MVNLAVQAQTTQAVQLTTHQTDQDLVIQHLQILTMVNQADQQSEGRPGKLKGTPYRNRFNF